MHYTHKKIVLSNQDYFFMLELPEKLRDILYFSRTNNIFP